MNKKTFALIFLYLQFVVVPLFAQTEKITGPVVNNSKTGKTWAVVIGISKYQNIPGLNYADKDAQVFYDYLVNTDGGPKLNPFQVKLLLNENALSTEIYGALDWLSESVKENDRVIIYFSGHGDVEKKTIYQDGFLLGYNSPAAAYMTSGTVSINYLQQYLETYIQFNKARYVILIADACHSGKLAGGSEGAQLTRQALENSPNKQIIKILSAQDNELSFEGKEWGGGRGVFSYYLMKGIEGLADQNNDDIINTAELAAYLPLAVADATGSVQHPTVDGGNPKQDIFTFNNELLKKAKNEDNIPISISSSLGDGIAGEIAPDVKILYEQYLGYLKKGWLVGCPNENDTISCAKNFYQKLINNPKAAVIKASLRSSFIAALQRQMQIALDNYVKGEKKQYFGSVFKEIAYLKRIITPDYVLYNYIMARACFLETDKKRKGRIAVLRKALEFEEDAPYVLNDLGYEYREVGMVDSAAYYLKKAIAVAPYWDSPYNGIGLIYDSLKNYDEAIIYYKKAILVNPKSLFAYNNIGITYQALNEYKEALDYHQKAAQLITGDSKQIKMYESKIYCNLGIDYQQLGDQDNAILNYQKAISLDSGYKAAYNNLGIIYQDQKAYDEAILIYQKVIRMDSSDKAAYNNLGIIYQGEKAYDKALMNFQKAINIDPGYADAYDNMGVTYAYNKEYSKGIAILRKAILLDPNNIVCYYNMACAYSIWNRTAKSLIYLKQVLEKGFHDYDQINQDNDLINLRKIPEFNVLMKRYFPDKVK